MNSKTVDFINFGLIILSLGLAYAFPMGLFVVVYAFLGPLHYLTEINWLKQKKFFIERKRNPWMLIGTIASFLIVTPKVLTYVFSDSAPFIDYVSWFNGYTNAFIFATLMLAIGFAVIKSKAGWIVLSVIILLGAILLNDMEAYALFIGLFIPTIIHVYIFTALFMLVGAKNSKSWIGYVNVIALLFAPVWISNLGFDPVNYVFNDAIFDIYSGNGFHNTPYKIAESLGMTEGNDFNVSRPFEIKWMMFISFIYLYHYLNWFSKTTVIGWHKNLTWKRTFVIVLAWVILLILFYIDYSLGFIVALFFSFLHVILEFPLNIQSIRALFKKTN